MPCAGYQNFQRKRQRRDREAAEDEVESKAVRLAFLSEITDHVNELIGAGQTRVAPTNRKQQFFKKGDWCKKVRTAQPRNAMRLSASRDTQ